MKTTLLLFLSMAAALMKMNAADAGIAAGAVNALGVDLYHTQAQGGDNVLLSPYSIQNALAMTFAGAAGDTHAEMQRVLHFPNDEEALHESFRALAGELSEAAQKSVERVSNSKKYGGPSTPIEFNLANRLFAEKDYEFRAAFLDLVKAQYLAPVEKVDYRNAPEKARAQINRWVEEQTKNKIRDLIPAGAIKDYTRLTLVNALYLRAPWSDQFVESATTKERFLVHGRESAEVPTMHGAAQCGYAKREGYQVVTRSYSGGELQFVIVLPDEDGGLAALEKQLTPGLLAECAHLPAQKVMLHLPKFRLEPPALSLGDGLQALGMKTAFDIPRGSANFDRMAPRQSGEREEVFVSDHMFGLVLGLEAGTRPRSLN